MEKAKIIPVGEINETLIYNLSVLYLVVFSVFWVSPKVSKTLEVVFILLPTAVGALFLYIKMGVTLRELAVFFLLVVFPYTVLILFYKWLKENLRG